MRALKTWLATYFVERRYPIQSLVWVHMTSGTNWIYGSGWTTRTGSEAGFQVWLDEPNPNYPDRRRRGTIHDDVIGIRV